MFKNRVTQWLLTLILLLSFLVRFYRLGETPASIYWDEASLGYNAYSISQTFRDEHGEFMPFSRFIAYGDYKAPGYIYIDAIAVKLLGLNEFSVRLPSALAGLLLVILTYFLSKELFDNNVIGLTSAFVMAISPWAIQFSRGGFEANLATLFSGWGVYFFLVWLRRKKLLFGCIASVLFWLAIYTFNSHRVFVPLFLFSLSLIFFKQIIRFWKQAVVASAILLLLLLPLIPHFTSREGKLRFYEVTWLNDSAPIELSNKRVGDDGGSILAKVLHNRRVTYFQEFLKHYSDHFRGDFLFLYGDVNPRLSSQTVGELYIVELPLLLLGVYKLLRIKSKTKWVIFSWIILSPIPAALARETPHALRILNILPAPQILIGLGLYSFAQFFSKKRIFLIIIPIIYFLLIILYLHNYHTHYREQYALSWQYGYSQMVQYVRSVESKYDGVGVTEKYGRPYIYFLFYEKYSPQKYLSNRNAGRDWYGFQYVYGFDKYKFDDEVHSGGKWLYVRLPKQTPGGANLIKVIYGLNGEPIFEISEK